MENASKALIMAASVLIALVIIGAFMLMMSNLTDYQDKSYQSTADAQTTEFNNQYVTYARDNVRGSDMISLMNKVVDYNSRKTVEGYTEMQVTITISSDIRKNLTYDGTNRLVTSNTYTEDTIDKIVGQPTSVTNSISGGKIRDIEDKYQQKYANQLSSEIANIETILKDKTLNTTKKQNEAFDEEQWLPKTAESYGGVSKIYQDALVYYEYVQFKRTEFKCITNKTQYDTKTGRIIKMEFECTGIGV